MKTIDSNLVSGNKRELLSREDFKRAFHLHGLTNIEVMEAFSMADINKDGVLSKPEWDGFFRFFVSPFQAITQKWRASKEELQNITTQPWFQQI